MPLPFPLSSRQESSRARQCCWLVTGQPLGTMQGCGSGGAQLQGWTRAWIPHPCTTWHHMDHDWAQGRTHVLPPGRPSLLPPPHLRAASGQVHPQVPIKSPDLGILLLPPLPHHPKHHGQSQGCTRESSRKGSSRVPLPVRGLWSCSVPGLGPSCPLGRDTQAVLRAPGVTCRELCCHRGAALATVRSVLDHRSCSGLAMPIAELQTMGQAPRILRQRTQNSTRRTCTAFAGPRGHLLVFAGVTLTEHLSRSLSRRSESCGSPGGLCAGRGGTRSQVGQQIQRLSSQAPSFPLTAELESGAP